MPIHNEEDKERAIEMLEGPGALMISRFRSLLAMAAAVLAGRRAASGADVDPSQLHTLIVTNHTDACMHVRLFRGEGHAPTTPPVKPRDLPPGESFSVALVDHPKDVYVFADVMSDPHCADRRVAGYMEGYAWLGHVIVAGKKPKYVFISKSLK